MDLLRVLVNIVVLISALVVIIMILLQQGNRQGLGAISGGAETFFGKNKARSYEGKLELITKIGATVFIACSIIMVILTRTS